MAHRKPQHPIEKWAEDAASICDTASGATKTKLLIESSLIEILKLNIDAETTARRLQQPLTQIIMAADCIEGKAQIVRIADGLYEDVLASKMSTNEDNDPRNTDEFPWPMFAIELNDCKSNIALVLSQTTYLYERAEAAEKIFGITNGNLVKLTEALLKSQQNSSATLALIPSKNTSTKALIDLVNSASFHRGAYVTNEIKEQFIKKLGTMPYPLWSEPDDDIPNTDQIVNLLLFVLSDNVERKQTYAPPKTTSQRKNNKKRKRCEAHLYEMGIAWSDAYAAYRKVIRSDPKGGHVRPHTRRGHFHRFRVGPRDGEIQYVTHWIPPTLVGDPTKAKPRNQGHIYR